MFRIPPLGERTGTSASGFADGFAEGYLSNGRVIETVDRDGGTQYRLPHCNPLTRVEREFHSPLSRGQEDSPGPALLGDVCQRILRSASRIRKTRQAVDSFLLHAIGQ